MGRPWKSPGKNMEKWDNQHNPTYTMKKYEKYIGIEKTYGDIYIMHIGIIYLVIVGSWDI
jgi:hypothetical protein